MEKEALYGAIESVLYVSGEPVGLFELQNAFEMTEKQLVEALNEMNAKMKSSGRGVLLFLTEQTVQLVTNPVYNEWVVRLLEPPEERALSNSMLETLSLIAYRQPITRTEIESVRGVRCEYSVSQLLKQGFIREIGRKDCVGHPMLFGTTDAFLRRFGLHSLDELPELPETSEERAEILEKARNVGQEAADTDAGEDKSAASELNFVQLKIDDVIQ